MIRRTLLAALAILCLLTPATLAQSPADALGKCLVNSSTGKDRVTLVEWIFSAMASDPDVTQFTKFSADQKTEVSKATAAVVVRLLTVDCRAQAIASLRTGNPEAMREAFGQLGRIAMVDIMANPSVRDQLGQLGKNMDQDAMRKLGEEAKQH